MSFLNKIKKSRKKIKAEKIGEDVYKIEITRTYEDFDESTVYIKASSKEDAESKANKFINHDINGYKDEECEEEINLSEIKWEEAHSNLAPHPVYKYEVTLL